MKKTYVWVQIDSMSTSSYTHSIGLGDEAGVKCMWRMRVFECGSALDLALPFTLSNDRSGGTVLFYWHVTCSTVV